MFVVVNSKKKLFWTGTAWSKQGKPFLSPASAVRSLHEQGEDTEYTLVLSNDFPPYISPRSSTIIGNSLR
jgi:hypothetical protein